MDDTCKICGNTFIKSNTPVKCEYCKNTACQECIETYILLNSCEARCMFTNCKRIYSIAFLYNNFGKQFINGKYKKHIGDILFTKSAIFVKNELYKIEYEKIYLLYELRLLELKNKYDIANNIRAYLLKSRKLKEYYQRQCPFIINGIKCDKQFEKIANKCAKCKNSLLKTSFASSIKLPELNSINHLCELEKIKFDASVCKDLGFLESITNESIMKINDTISLNMDIVYKYFINFLYEMLYTKKYSSNYIKYLYKNYTSARYLEKPDIKDIDLDYITNISCNINGCMGFLTNKNECTLCNIKICKQCDTIINGDHVCNDDVKTNMDMFSKNSNEYKSCPSCHVYTLKVDGCNDMWCLICNIFFDWETRKIIERKHNPDYIRANSTNLYRNPNDIICGREIDSRFINDFSYQVHKIDIYQENDKYSKFINHVYIYIFQDVDYIPYMHKLYMLIRNLLKLTNELHIVIAESANIYSKIYYKYAIKKIDVNQFKSMLFNKYLNDKKNEEFEKIISAFIINVTEIIHRYDATLSYIKYNHPILCNEYVSDKKNNTTETNIEMSISIYKEHFSEYQPNSYIHKLYLLEIRKLIEIINEELFNIGKIHNMKKYKHICPITGTFIN